MTGLNDLMPFGKFKGAPICLIADNNPTYFVRLLSVNSHLKLSQEAIEYINSQLRKRQDHQIEGFNCEEDAWLKSDYDTLLT